MISLLGVLLLLVLVGLDCATWAVAILSIACKVANWSLWVSILVLLSLLWSALSLSSWLEDWLWESGWRSWKLSGIGRGGEAVVALLVEVEEQSLPARIIGTVLHGCGSVAVRLKISIKGLVVDLDYACIEVPLPAFWRVRA